MAFKTSFHADISSLRAAEVNDIIGMAWADEVSFDDIWRKYGLAEKEVINLMKKSLKPSSYRLWRERVKGRKSKHEAKLRSEVHHNKSLQTLLAEASAEEDGELLI
ncbi:MAG: TIGR03643 family protein [Alphaproteobacteria bacterium]